MRKVEVRKAERWQKIRKVEIRKAAHLWKKSIDTVLLGVINDAKDTASVISYYPSL